MKKKKILCHFFDKTHSKTGLIMRLTCLLICSMVLGSYGNSFSQQQLVSLNLKQSNLIDLFQEIRNQTGLRFLFDAEKIKEVPLFDLKADNKPVREVLEEVLSNTKLRCEYGNDIIMLVTDNKNKKEAEQRFRQISGIITDSEKQALPGATIRIPNTTTGVIADAQGRFSINIPDGVEKLIISFIGYKTQEVTIGTAEILNIILEQKETVVDEVVVTGYTTIDKRLSASAVSIVKMDDIYIPGVNTLDKMLQGQVPGLMVVNQSGSPNATPRIRIRGSSTIHGNAAPLWVIDGIIWEDPVNISNDELNNILSGTADDFKDQINQNASLSLLGNSISGLNPNDIENLTFLKDASATAIYGTKAANGVIVVTTKKGKIGNPSINFSSSFGFTSRPRYQDYQLMNSKERIGVSKEVVENRYLYETTPYRTSYEGALLDFYDNLISKEVFDSRVAELEVMNTDWFDLLFRNAFNQDYALSISGGSERSNYYVSVNYGNNRGSSKGDNMTRYGLNFNINTRFGKVVDIDWRVNYSNRESEGFYMVNPMDYALNTSRAIHPDEFYTTAVSTVVDLPSNFPLSYNIFNELEHTGNTALVRQINASAVLKARITQNFNLQGTFATSYSNSLNRKWAAEKSFYIATIRGYDYGSVKPQSDAEKASALAKGGILHYSNTNQSSYTGRVQANYNKVFNNDHTLNATAGFEMRSVEYEGFETEEWGYFPDRGEAITYEYDGETSGSNWSYGDKSSLDKHNVKNVNTISNALSVYSTIVYGYKNRYILNANIRSDASNRFGQYTNNRFLPVWSIAGRWSVQQEEWLKNSSLINELNVRVSYGLQGSVPTSVGPNLVVKYPTTVYNRFTGDYVLNVSRYPYPDLTWEKTQTWNIGLDFSIFKNRISGNIDYYYKKGRNLIFSLDVPAEYGVNSIYRNGADICNTGFELSLMFTPVRTRDFQWTVSTIYSRNSNEVDKTSDNNYRYTDYLSGNAFKAGKPVKGVYSWEYTGLNSTNGIATYSHTKPYGETVEASDDPESYLVYSGQQDPKISGGFSTSLYYKNISLSGQFAFAFGNVKRLNHLFNGALKMPLPHDNLSSELLDRWRKPGDENHTDIPGFVFDGNTVNYMLETPAGMINSYEMYNYSTARVVKGDFFRCRNLSLSYYFTPKQLEKIGLKTLNCSFNVTNPFTICSKKFRGQDPEIDNTGSTALPITQSYTLSINFSF